MTILNQTIAVRAGIDCDSQHGAVTPPLYLSSNYSFTDFNQPRAYDYSRSGNPTRDLLANALAELEQAAGGVITSTGMSAILLVIQMLPENATVVAPHDCYGGTHRLLVALHAKGQIKVKFVDQSNHCKMQQVLKQPVDLLWIETPSNPLLRVVDIAALCELAGVGVLKAVDNTFLSPALQQPITLGADLVVHSTTKYINGHSDVVGGAVLAKTKELFGQLKWWANCLGVTAAPFDSLLTMRGLRTLHVRMKQHVENTEKIIEFLQRHPAVDKIHYPGLVSHQGYAIAKKQQQHFGAMLSFEVKGGTEEVKILVNQLKYFTLAESLGGVESLICHPATMTHAAMTPEVQYKAGIKASLIRLSVGIEQVDDLIADLDHGLTQALIQSCREQQHVK